MACCKCCCEGAGGVCCGSPGSETCCPEGSYCCGTTCQSTPCCDLTDCQMGPWDICAVCEESSPGTYTCSENYASYQCNGSNWYLDFEVCADGYVTPGPGECITCDPLTIEACIICCIPNPAP